MPIPKPNPAISCYTVEEGVRDIVEEGLMVQRTIRGGGGHR